MIIFTHSTTAAAAQPPSIAKSREQFYAVLKALPEKAAGSVESITLEKDGAYFVQIRESEKKCLALRFHLREFKTSLVAVADAREYECEK
ncbi:MAG: hypothetical protein ACXWQE_07715 [Bdellovibrionales bacterium]